MNIFHISFVAFFVPIAYQAEESRGFGQVKANSCCWLTAVKLRGGAGIKQHLLIYFFHEVVHHTVFPIIATKLNSIILLKPIYIAYISGRNGSYEPFLASMVFTDLMQVLLLN